MEYLYRHGRSIPQALMMMVPEAWGEGTEMSDEQRAFDEYNATFMAPWDGPAALCFTDGIQVGAFLDRNGLRPSRYTLTKDRVLVVASESGVVDVKPTDIEFLAEFLKEIEFNYPIIIDEGNEFLKNNTRPNIPINNG